MTGETVKTGSHGKKYIYIYEPRHFFLNSKVNDRKRRSRERASSREEMNIY